MVQGVRVCCGRKVSWKMTGKLLVIAGEFAGALCVQCGAHVEDPVRDLCEGCFLGMCRMERAFPGLDAWGYIRHLRAAHGRGDWQVYHGSRIEALPEPLWGIALLVRNVRDWMRRGRRGI